MHRLLLVTGDLATGKSTFADQLSKRYGIAVFHKDGIKEILGDTVGFSNREENLKLSKATMAMMQYLFSQAAALGNDLILEANFHEADLLELHSIAEKGGYHVLTLVLEGRIELLHKRFMQRALHEKRHPVHLSANMDDYEVFKAYLEKSRKEPIPGEQLWIDANTFEYQTDEDLRSKLDRFLGN